MKIFTKLIRCILICMLNIEIGNAQQLFSSSLTPQILPIFNPAFTGYDINREIIVGYRKSWIGTDDAPNTTYALYQTSLNNAKENSLPSTLNGVGAFASSDQIGGLSKTYFGLQYALHKKLTPKIRASIGVAGGISNWSFNSKNGLAKDENDPAIDAFFSGRVEPYFSLGGTITYDNFFLGISGQQLLKPNIKLSGEGDDSPLSTTGYITIGYAQKSPKGDWAFDPLVNLRLTKGSAVSTEMFVKATYNNLYFAGFGVRLQDAAPLVMVGVKHKSFGLQLAYDIQNKNKDGLYPQGANSLEFLISFRF